MDDFKQEIEYLKMQNNPYTATGAGLRYLCELKNVMYKYDEPDNVIRERLIKEIDNNNIITVKMSAELKGQFESLMNSIILNYQENEIQRQLGMLVYLYQKEIEENKYLPDLYFNC